MAPSNDVFAHSLSDGPLTAWEPLHDHLREVADKAAAFARQFGWSEAARAAGLLHDIGKCSPAFQAYIRNAAGAAAPGRIDHSTAGARELTSAYPGRLGRMLAFAVAGHHAGLADGVDLRRRLDSAVLENYAGWQEHTGGLPAAERMLPSRAPKPHASPGFTQAFLTRMLFSCLVDADWLATEAFVAAGAGEPVERDGFLDLPALRQRLRAHMLRLRADAPDTALNRLRAEVLDHAVARAALAPGLFTLTVPTGGGKTLASLSFALEHAVAHGLRRVVYVIPFTSIIEQTAAVFRDALGTDSDVLEHHASFEWERQEGRAADDEGRDGIRKLRRASENWDAPVVVTTAVQFFESLFASRRARCRKLHNLAGAVIVLDEAQTLPIHLLRPSLAALEELAANYDASVVICTATQPAWRRIDGALRDERKRPAGLDIGPERELAPEPARLYAALRRVRAEMMAEPIPDEVVVARFAEQPRMLCIVNSRAHARDLFDRIADLPGATHLTTLMCPRHRQAVLAQARRDLQDRKPVRLVATSLIEAGVDIDFPEVWRAVAGLDQIAQAAGRCNREGALDLGRLVVFEPAEHRPPRALAAFWQATQVVLRQHADDPLSLPAVEQYFGELYFQRGEAAALDAGRLDGNPWPILPAIAERVGEGWFPFASIAETYRLIDDVMAPVVVPYDAEAHTLLDRIAAMERPRGADLRRLQQYVVGIPARARQDLLASNVLRAVHPALGDALLRLDDKAHYRSATGLDLRNPTYRGPEDNFA